MARRKKNKNYKVIFSAVLMVAVFVLLFFIYWQISLVPQHLIYVSSENIKQGDTIFLKVSGKYSYVSGYFNSQSIDFFKSGIHSDWVAFLGIDVNTNPGKYKIYVNAQSEAIEKEINIIQKDFASVILVANKEQISKGFTDKKVAENITKKDNPTLNEILAKVTPEPYFKGSFDFPLSNMQVSGLDFGQMVGNKSYQLRHLGVDLRAAVGTKIFSINNGEVVLVKELSDYGKTIIIDHGLGIFSLYLHLDKYEVAEGDYVKKDQVIALSGNSGYSTAPHLHFSIRDNGARVSPISFIEATQQTEENFNLADIGKAFLNVFHW